MADVIPRSSVRSTAALAVVALLSLVLVVRVAIGQADDGTGLAVGSAAADLASSTTTSTTTTEPPATTAPPAPTTTEPPLPEPLPSDPYAATPAVTLGRMRIPKLGVDQPLGEGMTLTAINRGPSHWPGTAGPGERGNMVVAGHRTTMSRPFLDLDKLAPGDTVVVDTPQASYTYLVRGVIVVPESHIGIASANGAHTATLFACHPKGSATHRIVAKLALLGPDGRLVDDEAVLPPVDFGTEATASTLVVRSTESSSTPLPVDPFAGSSG